MSPILHIITGLGVGGAETMLAQVAASLHAGGMPQHVVTLRDRGPMADVLEEKNVPVTALNVRSLAGMPGGLFNLRRLVEQFQPSVIQGWMYHGNLAAALAHRFAPRRDGRKLYWNIRSSVMDAAYTGSIVKRSAWLSTWPDLIISNSQAGMDFHIECGFKPRNSMVIPNGFDTEKFRPDPDARRKVRAELGIPDNAVVALLSARVHPMKDHEGFLSAMASVPGVHGLLVGKDTQKLTLPGNVSALGLRNDIARICAASDIVVCNSYFGEGFSNALAEGMSSGLVPVATDIGDAAMIISDTGQIILPRNPEALAQAISDEADRTTQERHRRGLQARQRIVDNFTLDRIVEMYSEIYSNDRI